LELPKARGIEVIFFLIRGYAIHSIFGSIRILVNKANVPSLGFTDVDAAQRYLRDYCFPAGDVRAM
jgi:hypothetical protein